MEASNPHIVKKLYNLGFSGYVLLIVLSLIFYKERCVFLDASLYIFDLVRTHNFAIYHFRNIAVFPEIFPLTGRWLNADLKVIAMLFSSGYILIHLVCYWLCGMMKKYEYGLILLLYNLLLIADSFYALPSELPIGVAFLILMLAFIDYRNGRQGVFSFIIVAVLGFFVVLSHPLIIFPLSYLIIWLFIYKKQLRRDLIITSILLMLLTVLKLKYFVDEYDVKSSAGILKMLDSHYFDLPSHKVLLHNILTKFYWLPILFVGVSVYLVLQRKWLLLILFSGYLAGYVLVINVTYSDGKAAAFYIENFYLLLGVFLAAPLVFNMLPAFKKVQLPVVLFSLVVLIAGIRIYMHHDIYTQRLNWERGYLNENIGKKLIVDEAKTPMNILIMSWATPYEFWLLSTLENDESASIMINPDPGSHAWFAEYNQSFMPTWGRYPYNELPAKYFKFTDTTSSYRVVK